MEEGINRSHDTMTITDNAYNWDFKATTTSEAGLTDVGFDDDFMIDFHRSLKECVERCGGVYDENVGRVGEMMISAFADHNVHSYTLDYGSRYNALSISVLLDDDLRFFVRCEMSDEEGDIIGFSIRRGKTLLYSNFDKLPLFKKHLDEFFSNLQQSYCNVSVSEGTSAPIGFSHKYAY